MKCAEGPATLPPFGARRRVCHNRKHELRLLGGCGRARQALPCQEAQRDAHPGRAAAFGAALAPPSVLGLEGNREREAFTHWPHRTVSEVAMADNRVMGFATHLAAGAASTRFSTAATEPCVPARPPSPSLERRLCCTSCEVSDDKTAGEKHSSFHRLLRASHRKAIFNALQSICSSRCASTQN